MKGAKLAAATVAGMVVLLIAGIGVSAALADPGNGNGSPSTVPGSPGDDCSHGNSGTDCRPDPNEHGKDCDDHGNARGNEDHCDRAATTTTTTTIATTTTNEMAPTTLTSPTPTTHPNTTPRTTTNPKSPGTSPPTPGAGPAGASGGTGPSSTPNPPVTKPELHKELAKQVVKARAGRLSHARASRGELPFTGFPGWAYALLGSAILATGLGLRRVTS
jgi:hypothetical protein